MGLFTWWAGQNPWLRYGFAILLILISTLLLLAGRIWIWGWVAGVIMLLAGGRTSSEKNGYRF